jgi:hypothetical protein
MTTRLRVRLAQPSTPELVGRLRNLGENLHRSLGDKGHVDMDEVDAATEFFWVEVPAKRDLGDVTLLLKKHLERSGRDGAFTMERP